MGLLHMSRLSPAERAYRREVDEACFRRVHAEVERGVRIDKAFTSVAGHMRIDRHQVVAGYWRHHRRMGTQ